MDEKIKKYLKEIEPREYQWKIFDTCKNKNCLVILPTGTGKTLIALMLTIERMIKFPDKKILFLAPTRPLAEQHLNYFKKNLPELFATMELFTGKTPAEKRKKLWQNAEIIFSTPQCIRNDLKNNFYNLNDVSLLIEDECHRCVKNYSYTYIAEKYKQQSENSRILGLTASPGHEKEKIKKIFKNLGIEDIEIRTRESEDVKSYLQELKFNIIKLDFPPEFLEIKELLKQIYKRKIQELKNRKLLFGFDSKTALLKLQAKIMNSIMAGKKNFNMFAGASVCAQAIKIHHAIELLETQTLSSFESYMQDLFEQARKQQSKAVVKLVNQEEFKLAYSMLKDLIAKKIEHPKLGKLKEIVEKEIKKNLKAKIMVFAQYRDTSTKICKELNQIQNINARVFVGQAKKIRKKETTGMNQKEQQQLIKEFSLGIINVIASTSIGEEGLDIPEVNMVIFYEPIPSAIRQIQRRGRTARLQKGELIILVTKNTRDEAYYWSAFNKEKKMHKILNTIKEELNQDIQKTL
ncbi:MAG: DEAD/DEAH box helicase family protein [Nanoarchaeota archaeon]|nr:DEAD/DEAH box helicase family protein [Nanoarchaeota archaeon]